MTCQDLKLKYPNIKWICTDCFDTLLHRTCTPIEVLERFFSMFSREVSLAERDFKEIWNLSRKKLQSEAGIVKKEELSFHELARETYVRFSVLHRQCHYSYEEYEKKFYDVMLEAENQVILVNDELVDWLKEEKNAGKEIVCISDFYMSGAWLQSLLRLRHLDELFDHVYVSSDLGLRKSTGRLYEYVREQLKCASFGEMMMIGDQKNSDYLIPQKLGIHALLYQEKIVAKKVKDIEQQFQILYCKNKALKMPFVNYVFSLYLFCGKLREELTKESIRDIWFFSREGKALKSLFEEYLRLHHVDSIQCHYLFVSRQATFLPSLTSIDKEDFYFLKCKARDLSLHDFCEGLGLLESQLEGLLVKYDFDRVEKDFFDGEVFQRFIAEEEFLRVYDAEREKERQAAIAYFQSRGLGIRSDEKYAVVDLGWKGSIQDCIARAFHEEANLYGYYYGLTGNVCIEGHNVKKGLVFSDFPLKSRDYNIYAINYRMLERILCADHGGCLKYTQEGPIFKEFDKNEDELYHFVEPIQKQILEEFGQVAEILDQEAAYGNSKILRDIAIAYIHKSFALDWNQERIRQMKYMDRRMDVNFAAFERKQGNRSKEILRRLIKGENRTEVTQKLILALYKTRLGFFAAALRTMALATVKKERRG